MAKKPSTKSNQTSLSLDKLVPSYGRLKAQMAEEDKAAKLLNSRIKTAMEEQKITEHEAGGYIASYSVRTSESFDTEKLLDFCKAHKDLKDCIKVAEFVDMDALENLIYEGKLPKKLLLEMDKMRVKKQTVYLNIAKSKEK